VQQHLARAAVGGVLGDLDTASSEVAVLNVPEYHDRSISIAVLADEAKRIENSVLELIDPEFRGDNKKAQRKKWGGANHWSPRLFLAISSKGRAAEGGGTGEK
jgi:hypothetical protein